ncbi:ankyrin [Rhizoclosmatium globosum]|uniref:Ankyrin n=1 Tax=Rhizoclosmatium globosum TaxID=329046 RepID=A0A1Y2CFV7_9FUNG|nr:ankyrin [Rhizoclosmatium globosum]|eukprot:ORY45931.1 ankyrin [Rhizoclosmatium globosum]
MNQPPATVPDTLHDPEPKITSLAKGHESSHHQNIKSHHKHKIHHGALSDESAGFMQTPAISMGDLEQLARLLETSPDFICERGPYGETILHIAILKKNADVAEWIVRNYGDDTIPVLLESGDRDGRAFGRQYDGQTALHQACKNGMKSLIELLVDKKVDANAQAVGAAFQEYSTNWEYPNLYSGSTPLHFAASRRDTFETVKTLVERGGADIYQQDAYGNNILHVMAYFGIFNETYKYIMTRNERI